MTGRKWTFTCDQDPRNENLHIKHRKQIQCTLTPKQAADILDAFKRHRKSIELTIFDNGVYRLMLQVYFYRRGVEFSMNTIAVGCKHHQCSSELLYTSNVDGLMEVLERTLYN